MTTANITIPETKQLDEIAEHLTPMIREGVSRLIEMGLEVYYLPPRRPLPQSTTTTSWVYFTESLEEDKPLGTFGYDLYDYEGKDGLYISSSLVPTKLDGSSMGIIGGGEGLDLTFQEGVQRALLDRPSNSFQGGEDSPHIRNAGAHSAVQKFKDLVRIVL